MSRETHHLVFDLKLRRPGCALLQAALGGSAHIANRFPAELWLQAPTPDMRCYRITEAQLVQLIDLLTEKGPPPT